MWFLQNETRFLTGRGFDVRAISSPGELLEQFHANSGVPVHPVAMRREISPVSDLSALCRLWGILQRRRPDIVHAHTPKAGLLAMIAAWLARVKLRVYTINGLPLLARRGWESALLRMADKFACALATHVLCVSRSIRQVTIDLDICPEGKIRTLGHGSCAGVDLERFNPAIHGHAGRRRVRDKYGIPESVVVVGFVGRFVRDKGIVELATAWQRLRAEFANLHLLCCGEFEPQDPVPVETRRLLEDDPRVHFTEGFLSDMPPVYAAIDLCVLPTYREGLGMVALECAAMEVPIVATRIPGCVDAVQDRVTGLLVEPRSPGALVDALRRLLRDPDLRRSMGKAGREFVATRFDEPQVLELLFREYQRLLGERGLRTLPCQACSVPGTPVMR